MTKVVQQSTDPTWGSLCDAYFSSYSNPLKKGDLDFGLCGSYLQAPPILHHQQMIRCLLVPAGCSGSWPCRRWFIWGNLQVLVFLVASLYPSGHILPIPALGWVSGLVQPSGGFRIPSLLHQLRRTPLNLYPPIWAGLVDAPQIEGITNGTVYFSLNL